MNWNTYAERRNINVDQWLAARGVKDRESFIITLRSLNVEPPDDQQLLSMFPPATPTVEKGVNYESTSITSEGSNQAPTRGVVGEGDRADQRSDRKRSPKVRS